MTVRLKDVKDYFWAGLKVDFAICQNSDGVEVPLDFIESESNALSAEHEVRKLVNLAAPLRVLTTVIQWDEESDV